MSIRRPTGRGRRYNTFRTQYADTDPRKYGTPAWWHRSDAGITLNVSKVVTWADQSGNAVDVTQGTDATRPTYSAGGGPNGYPSLRFANQSLNRSLGSPLLTTDWTVVLVCRATTLGSTSGTFLRHGHVANNTGLEVASFALTRRVTCKGAANHDDASMTADVWEIMAVTRTSGSAPTMTVNNSAQALSNSANTTYNTGANILDYGVAVNVCELAEVIAYNSVVDTTALVTALRTKYAI